MRKNSRGKLLQSFLKKGLGLYLEHEDRGGQEGGLSQRTWSALWREGGWRVWEGKEGWCGSTQELRGQEKRLRAKGKRRCSQGSLQALGELRALALHGLPCVLVKWGRKGGRVDEVWWDLLCDKNIIQVVFQGIVRKILWGTYSYFHFINRRSEAQTIFCSLPVITQLTGNVEAKAVTSVAELRASLKESVFSLWVDVWSPQLNGYLPSAQDSDSCQNANTTVIGGTGWWKETCAQVSWLSSPLSEILVAAQIPWTFVPSL